MTARVPLSRSPCGLEGLVKGPGRREARGTVPVQQGVSPRGDATAVPAAPAPPPLPSPPRRPITESDAPRKPRPARAAGKTFRPVPHHPEDSRMKIHEYQAKELLAAAGAAVPRGLV